MRIRIASLLSTLLLWVASAQLAPTSFPDIAGDGNVHAISSLSGAPATARTIQFVAGAGNSTASCSGNTVSGCVRIGDSTISSTRGIYLLPGAVYYMPESSGAQRYSLSSTYYLIQSGDKLTIQITQ
jgi:hypothetical protein